MSYTDENERKETSPFTIIAGFLGAAGGWALSHYFGLAALIPFLCAFVGLIGMGMYSKNNSVDVTGVKIMAWSSLITWILPFLGMITAAATLGARAKSVSNNKLYLILGSIGALLSIINGGIGIWLAMQANSV